MDASQTMLPKSTAPALVSRRQILRAASLGGLTLGFAMPGVAGQLALTKDQAGQADKVAPDPVAILKQILYISTVFNALADKWMSEDPSISARRLIYSYLYLDNLFPTDSTKLKELAEKILESIKGKTCICNLGGTDVAGYDPEQCVYDGGTCVHLGAPDKARAGDPWVNVKKAIGRIAVANSLAYRWLKGKAEAQEVILFIRHPMTWKKENPDPRTACTCRFDDKHIYPGLTLQQCSFLGGYCQDHAE